MNFKKGQEVYDEVNAPGSKGVVEHDNTFAYSEEYPLRVRFPGILFTFYYTSDGRLYTNSQRTLSTKPYEFVEPTI